MTKTVPEETSHVRKVRFYPVLSCPIQSTWRRTLQNPNKENMRANLWRDNLGILSLVPCYYVAWPGHKSNTGSMGSQRKCRLPECPPVGLTPSPTFWYEGIPLPSNFSCNARWHLSQTWWCKMITSSTYLIFQSQWYRIQRRWVYFLSPHKYLVHHS